MKCGVAADTKTGDGVVGCSAMIFRGDRKICLRRSGRAVIFGTERKERAARPKMLQELGL